MVLFDRFVLFATFVGKQQSLQLFDGGAGHYHPLLTLKRRGAHPFRTNFSPFGVFLVQLFGPSWPFRSSDIKYIVHWRGSRYGRVRVGEGFDDAVPRWPRLQILKLVYRYQFSRSVGVTIASRRYDSVR